MIPKLKHPSKTELPELSWTAVILDHKCAVSIINGNVAIVVDVDRAAWATPKGGGL